MVPEDVVLRLRKMPTRIAIAVVIDYEDRVLIGRRPEGVPLAGLWEFPGGKIEPGEDAETAARRECLEEAGVIVDVVAEFPSQVEQYAHGAVELNFFECRPLEKSPRPKAPYLFVKREELRRYEFPSGNRRVLDLLLTAKGV